MHRTLTFSSPESRRILLTIEHVLRKQSYRTVDYHPFRSPRSCTASKPICSKMNLLTLWRIVRRIGNEDAFRGVDYTIYSSLATSRTRSGRCVYRQKDLVEGIQPWSLHVLHSRCGYIWKPCFRPDKEKNSTLTPDSLNVLIPMTSSKAL